MKEAVEFILHTLPRNSNSYWIYTYTNIKTIKRRQNRNIKYKIIFLIRLYYVELHIHNVITESEMSCKFDKKKTAFRFKIQEYNLWTLIKNVGVIC